MACVTQSRTLDLPVASLPKGGTLELGCMSGKSVPGANKLQDLYRNLSSETQTSAALQQTRHATLKFQNSSVRALCNPTFNKRIFPSFAVRIFGSQCAARAGLPHVSRWMDAELRAWLVRQASRNHGQRAVHVW